MAQLGLHGVIGMSLARTGSFRAASPSTRRTLLYAFVLGNLLPDADMFLVGAFHFFDGKMALNMHRSFSHSLITAAAVYAAGRLARREETRALTAGLALGMASHILTDVFTWFTHVTLLWPLNFWLPQIATVNLWASVRPLLPPVVPSLLAAAECLFFVLYSLALLRSARRLEEDTAFLPRLRWFLVAQAVAFCLYLPLAFILDPDAYNLALYVLFIPVFLPIAFYTTVRMRATLGRLGEEAKLE